MNYHDRKSFIYSGLINELGGHLKIRDVARDYINSILDNFKIDISSKEDYMRAYNILILLLPLILEEFSQCISSGIILYQEGNEIKYDEFLSKTCSGNPRFEMILVVVIGMIGSHQNVLLVDHLEKTVEHYEPWGNINLLIKEKKINEDDLLYDIDLVYNQLLLYIDSKYPGYVLLPTDETCKYVQGIQLKAKEGWCALFSILYIYIRVLYSDMSQEQINDFMDRIPPEDFKIILEALVLFASEYALEKKWLSYNVISNLLTVKKGLLAIDPINIILIGINGDLNQAEILYSSIDPDYAALYHIYEILYSNIQNIESRILLIKNILDISSRDRSEIKENLYNLISRPQNMSLNDQIEELNLLLEKYIELDNAIITYDIIYEYDGNIYPTFNESFVVGNKSTKPVVVGFNFKNSGDSILNRKYFYYTSAEKYKKLMNGPIGNIWDLFKTEKVIGITFSFKKDKNDTNPEVIILVNPYLINSDLGVD